MIPYLFRIFKGQKSLPESLRKKLKKISKNFEKGIDKGWRVWYNIIRRQERSKRQKHTEA
jgi:hypothetical protein